MIFVDAGAWYALATPSDPDHAQAKLFATSIPEPFVTSDYIVDELLTLFGVRRQKPKGIEWKRDVLDRGGVGRVRVSEEDFANALRIYEQFQDKEWSFTDCTRYVVIQRLQIKQAFSFDHHFRQFGIVTAVPATALLASRRVATISNGKIGDCPAVKRRREVPAVFPTRSKPPPSWERCRRLPERRDSVL